MANQYAVHSDVTTSAFGNLLNRGQSLWHDYFSLEIDGVYDRDLGSHQQNYNVARSRSNSMNDVAVCNGRSAPSGKNLVVDAKPIRRSDSVVSMPDHPQKVSSCDPEVTTPSGGRPASPPRTNEPSCLNVSALSACVITIVCAFVVLGRDYVKYVLLSLENSNIAVSFTIFALLFAAVSFPVTWGYILLNIAAGYLYGLPCGLALVVSCAMFGVVMAHLTIRRFLSDFVRSRLVSPSMRSIVNVVESEHGFKVIVLARLTPIPFGLQNALFAMSNISIQRYVAASATGMLPCQGLHAYVGSTLRSMEEVISSSSSSSMAYVVFGGQLVMVLALFIFVIRKARLEFNRTVQEAEDESLSPAVIESIKSSSKSFPFVYDDISAKSFVPEVTVR
jgi:uncharacterized membrane protein YdjX (TVP38/TMEM64 family)